jgi:hypothetical protein
MTHSFQRPATLAALLVSLAALAPLAQAKSLGWDCHVGEQFHVMVSGDREDVVVREYSEEKLRAQGFLNCLEIERKPMTLGLVGFARCQRSYTQAGLRLLDQPFLSNVPNLSSEYQVTLLENATTGTGLFVRISKKYGGALRIIDTVECSERNPNPIR